MLDADPLEPGTAPQRDVPELSGVVEHHILERMVHDIRYLLLNTDEQEQEPEVVYLWDDRIGTVTNGIKLMRRPLPQSQQGQIDLKPGFSGLSAGHFRPECCRCRSSGSPRTAAAA